VDFDGFRGFSVRVLGLLEMSLAKLDCDALRKELM